MECASALLTKLLTTLLSTLLSMTSSVWAADGLDDPAGLIAEAVRLEHGEGVPRDTAQARHLYCRAARAGEAQAQYALGWMLANGRGGPRDDGAAGMLFAMAAAQGHSQAQTMLHMTPAGAGATLPSCMLPDLPDVSASAAPPEISLRYRDGPHQKISVLVDRLAPQFQVDPDFVLAIISVESAYNGQAVSPRNAQGLMQLIPETARRFNVRNVFDHEQNVCGGLAYLRWLLAYFKGNVQLVAAAYNAGEKAVERYRGVPPYAETREYVKKIANLYKKATHPYQRDLLLETSQIPNLENSHK